MTGSQRNIYHLPNPLSRCVVWRVKQQFKSSIPYRAQITRANFQDVQSLNQGLLTPPPTLNTPITPLTPSKFTDDQSGKNVNIEVNPNGHSQSVASLVAGTPIATDGFVNAVELVGNFTNIVAVVKNNNQEIGKATGNSNNVARFARTSIQNMTVEVTKLA